MINGGGVAKDQFKIKNKNKEGIEHSNGETRDEQYWSRFLNITLQ
jgi:hypothetical protein